MIPELGAEATITAVAEVLDYMGDPANAFGVWIAASGLIAGAHFLSPTLLHSL